MMTVKEKKHSYCSQSQKHTLINLLEEKENEPLLSGKFSQTFTFQDAKNKWQNIAVEKGTNVNPDEGNEVVLTDPSAVAATTLAEVRRDTLDMQKQYYETKTPVT
ncbi:hypothetical protein JTB14_037954 [Gonioctena quinquepunctata]|nr:hypothetical protein JTB14_037954 [Gonioctena quinquepunctata]